MTAQRVFDVAAIIWISAGAVSLAFSGPEISEISAVLLLSFGVLFFGLGRAMSEK